MSLISEHIYKLTQGTETVTTELAKNPSKDVGHVAEKLYAKENCESEAIIEKLRTITLGTKDTATIPSQKDLDRAYECGKFGKRPSDLFLKIWHDVLLTLSSHPLVGVCSPPLLGSRGVLPLSILSPTTPDIMQHYYDVIITAQHEVFLATNYWQVSNASSKVIAAMKELSKRAQERGKKVIFKLMYDRGNPQQVLENHILVPEADFTAPQVALPKREELPGLDFEVVNYHKPPLGTFHAKYMVIDRRYAILNSNNIQDMPNMEMMIHLEGPIVDSFYDVCLLSWDRVLNPPLPLLGVPATERKDPYQFGMDNPLIACKELLQPHKQKAVEEGGEAPHPDTIGQETKDVTLPDRFQFMHHVFTDGSKPLDPRVAGYQPHVVHSPQEEFPMALVNRRPYGAPGHQDTFNPQDIAWLAGMKYAEKKIFVQTPDFNAKPIVEAALAAVKRGVECTLYICVGYNDAGEALPFQGGTNEEVVKGMYAKLSEHEKKSLKVYWYTAVDQKRPIHASEKKRNCHIKLMIIDEQVGIQGNGNQDAQSWYHSQETNIMIDNGNVCREWLGGIRETQNTHKYGAVQQDGVWRDEEGKEIPGSNAITSGPMGLLQGIKGSIARVRGTGGF